MPRKKKEDKKDKKSVEAKGPGASKEKEEKKPFESGDPSTDQG
jgi:hypothetical protein